MLSPELASELRAARPVASPELRDRVLAVAARKEPQQRPRFSFPPLRRMALVGVAAALALAVGGALVHGITNSGSPAKRVSGASSGAPRVGGSLSGQQLSQKERARVPQVLPKVFTGSVPNTSSRLQRYGASLRVQVKNLDALSDATKRAMRFARLLGGYVASVSQSSERGEPGEADLVLRVPVSRVEDAMIQLSALGTVLEQHVSIVDLENTVRQQRQQVRALQLQIVRLTAALRQSLPADVRLRLQFQLDDARRNLRAATGARKATLREAALSRISLALTTEHAAATATHHRGRFGNAVSAAVGFLEGAGAIALAALIVLAPLALIVALVLWGVRTVRRRTADRVLAAS